MATIDLIVLGILKKESMSAYDIQKMVEYRNISKWVKISTPSIYKKVIQLEKLMLDISCKPIHIFLDFNAVIVNLDSLSKDNQKLCLDNIENNIKMLKSYIEENRNFKKNIPEIPETGLAVLEQQAILVQAIETWIMSMREHLNL